MSTVQDPGLSAKREFISHRPGHRISGPRKLSRLRVIEESRILDSDAGAMGNEGSAGHEQISFERAARC